MLEEADAVLDGLRIAARITGAREGLIGVEDNKPDAIEALRRVAGSDARVARCAPNTRRAAKSSSSKC